MNTQILIDIHSLDFSLDEENRFCWGFFLPFNFLFILAEFLNLEFKIYVFIKYQKHYFYIYRRCYYYLYTGMCLLFWKLLLSEMGFFYIK